MFLYIILLSALASIVIAFNIYNRGQTLGIELKLHAFQDNGISIWAATLNSLAV